MQAFLCVVHRHKIIKVVRSGWLVSIKGENRNVAVFDGELHVCQCGKELFKGRPYPWFEGTLDQFQQQFAEQSEMLLSA